VRDFRVFVCHARGLAGARAKKPPAWQHRNSAPEQVHSDDLRAGGLGGREFHDALWQGVLWSAGLYAFWAGPVQRPVCCHHHRGFCGVAAAAGLPHQRVASRQQHTVPHAELLRVLECRQHCDRRRFLQRKGTLSASNWVLFLSGVSLLFLGVVCTNISSARKQEAGTKSWKVVVVLLHRHVLCSFQRHNPTACTEDPTSANTTP